MGCDIHSVIQIRDEHGGWKTIGEGYRNRNYDAFGMLADVRNPGRPVISTPKGLPSDFVLVGTHKEDHPIDDATFGIGLGWYDTWHSDYRDKIRARRQHRIALGKPKEVDPDGYSEEDYLDLYWMGDHSHSWLSPSEFDVIDWDRGLETYTLVPVEQFLTNWLRGDAQTHVSPAENKLIYPFREEYQVDVDGLILEEQYLIEILARDATDPERIATLTKLLLTNTPAFVRSLVLIPFADVTGTDFIEFVSWFRQLGHEHGDENVRMVFGFDS